MRAARSGAARTRLPGGGDNPVAIIKVPGSGWWEAGSRPHWFTKRGIRRRRCFHWWNHCARCCARWRSRTPAEADAWQLWERWISEIVADVWSVGRVGIASTLGLMGVVSLPRAFVFRVNPERSAPDAVDQGETERGSRTSVLSAGGLEAVGASFGKSYYPLNGATAKQRDDLLHAAGTDDSEVGERARPPSTAALRGRSVLQALDTDELRPSRLRALLTALEASVRNTCTGPGPIVVFAAIGQGTGGWRDHAGRRERRNRETAHTLGGVEHIAGGGRLLIDIGQRLVARRRGREVRPELKVRNRLHLKEQVMNCKGRVTHANSKYPVAQRPGLAFCDGSGKEMAKYRFRCRWLFCPH